jgi:hypothetical protein
VSSRRQGSRNERPRSQNPLQRRGTRGRGAYESGGSLPTSLPAVCDRRFGGSGTYCVSFCDTVSVSAPQVLMHARQPRTLQPHFRFEFTPGYTQRLDDGASGSCGEAERYLQISVAFESKLLCSQIRDSTRQFALSDICGRVRGNTKVHRHCNVHRSSGWSAAQAGRLRRKRWPREVESCRTSYRPT